MINENIKNLNKKEVGSRIKQIRLNKGYTLESFGKLFGARKGNVQQWENGVSLPNKKRIIEICKLANITIDELFYGANINLYDEVDKLSKKGKLLLAKRLLEDVTNEERN